MDSGLRALQAAGRGREDEAARSTDIVSPHLLDLIRNQFKAFASK